MPPEHEFRKWITSNADKDWLIQPIETMTGSGVPDLYMCLQGYQCWAELKATDSAKCYMRVSQWRWFAMLIRRGGFGILIIKRIKAKQIDVYIMSHILKVPPDKCILKGNDVIFPDSIRPAFTYYMGTGSRQFFAKLTRLFEDNYDY